MLVVQRGTFGSEIPANDDGWEKKEGGIMGAVSCLCAWGKGISYSELPEMGYGLADSFLSILVLLFLQTILVINLIANMV